jgi:hypothetical protein
LKERVAPELLSNYETTYRAFVNLEHQLKRMAEKIPTCLRSQIERRVEKEEVENG